MQRKAFQKPIKGRKTTEFHNNVVPSLCIDKLPNQYDCSVIYNAASAAVNYARGSIFSLFSRQSAAIPKDTPKPFDPDEQSNLINQKLLEYADQIRAIQTKIKPIKEAIQDKKNEINALRQQKNPDKKKSPAKNDTDAQDTNSSLKSVTDQLAGLRSTRADLLAQIDELELQRVELVAENIREHAIRRVEFLFLLMIAVYKKNLEISKGKTTNQHGRGNENTTTAACHDSLYPALTFKQSDSLLNRVASYWPLTLFSTQPNAAPDIDESPLDNTYLNELLNTTTELPESVNKFDMHMETRGFEKSSLVKVGVEILNRVSRGEINPIQGMNEFCGHLHLFFEAMKYTYIIPMPDYMTDSKERAPKTFAKIWEYQQQGIHRIVSSSHQLKSGYIYMMLGLHKLSKIQYAATTVYNGHIEQRMLEMQNEMLIKFDLTTYIKKNKDKAKPIAKYGKKT